MIGHRLGASGFDIPWEIPGVIWSPQGFSWPSAIEPAPLSQIESRRRGFLGDSWGSRSNLGVEPISEHLFKRDQQMVFVFYRLR